MNITEQEYLSKVRRVMTESDSPKATAIALMNITSPETKDFSLNTQQIEDVVYELGFAYRDGALEMTDADPNDSDDSKMNDEERTLITRTLEEISKALKDINDKNWYRHNYYVRNAYSKVEGEDYLYKVIDKRLGSIPADEATQIKEQEALAAPQHHPEDPAYTLEYTSLGVDIDDSKGNRIHSQLGSPRD